MRQLEVHAKKFTSYKGKVKEGELDFILNLDEPPKSSSGAFILKKNLCWMLMSKNMGICLREGSILYLVEDLNTLDRPQSEKQYVKTMCDLNKNYVPVTCDGELLAVDFEKLLEAST